MHIVYFSQKDQFLAEMDQIQGEKVFVTPSPLKADGLRSRLKNNASQDVITIAKFTSELINALWDGKEKPQLKRKSELLLIFGILKNKYLPDLGFEQFKEAYNVFSDLRSFTLDLDALSSVLEEQAESIRTAVQIFWKLLEVTNYLDEHGTYHVIAESLRSSEENDQLRKTFIFWGFQHLNGQQVDLLKALSIRYEVVIPFPLTLKNKIKKTDWISWLQDSKTQEKELASESRSPRAKWISINSREVSLHLKELIKPHDQIVLGVSKLSPLHMDIIPSQKVSFKIPHQILSFELSQIADKLRLFSGNILELKDLLQKEISLTKNLKLIRGFYLYVESLEVIQEMTDEEIPVDGFFLKLLNEVVNLNQPRTSWVPVSQNELNIDLKDMSSLEDIDRKRRVFFCIDERFEDIQGLGQNYPESIQKSLTSLGPMKRNELELLFKQWEFRDLFSDADVTVLMNEGTLKHSLVWKRLFSEIELVPQEKTFVSKERILKDHFASLEKKSFEGTFSASKFQTFIDCPRKFYFNFVDKVFPDIVFEKDFDPMTSGTIIHEIIEMYFKRNLSLDDIKSLTTEVMNKYIQMKSLKLPKETYLQRELVFLHRATNGIQFVKNLETMIGEKVEWKIEESFELSDELQVKGRIDCFGTSSKYAFLLDFKSSVASTATEVADLEAIQLWVYSLASKKKISPSQSIVMGYIVLDDPEKSTLLADSLDFQELIKTNKFSKFHFFKDGLEEKLKAANEKLVALTLAIKSEKSFSAKPRKASQCDWCELNKVCVKSEIADV